jgi:hypothetical protein
MTWRPFFGIACAVAILVVLVAGIAPWNLLPLIFVFGWAAVVQWEDGPGKGPVPLVAAPGLAVFGFVTLVHLAWYFDWGGTATGSSTAILLLLFTPLWAIAIGAATAIGVALFWPDPRGKRGRRTSGCS